jgi:hypothetical protein
MYKYSKNKKLENALCGIEQQLLDLGLEEVKHYYNEPTFKHKTDYNIAQYGSLLVYYADVQEFYKECGYKTTFSDSKIWEIYKRQVGYVTRKLMEKGE